MKVKLNIKKDGSAVIEEGKDSFIGKLIAAKGKVKINTPTVKRDVIVK